MDNRLKIISQVKRIVIKIGSSVLGSLDNGLNKDSIQNLAQGVAELRQKGYEVLMVSSGAVLAGRKHMGLKEKPVDIPLKQAAASVGQTKLMQAYEEAFARHGLKVGQILLTRDDISHRRRYLNARNTLFTLLRYGVVPIINENDTVTVEEIKLGDNDNLSALVTGLVGADLLIILSDVEGLCTGNPFEDKAARLIHTVRRFTPKLYGLAGQHNSQVSAGGMGTKLQAAQKAVSSGAHAIIACGHKLDILAQIMDGEEVGTLFLSCPAPLTSRKQWIAHAVHPRGVLKVDAGAREALVRDGKSLLPSGILAVEGKFNAGDAVSLAGPDGREFAKGLTNYQAHEVQQIQGLKTGEIEKRLGYKYYDEIIHRDNLVIIDTNK